jgi:hypothetical protein
VVEKLTSDSSKTVVCIASFGCRLRSDKLDSKENSSNGEKHDERVK